MKGWICCCNELERGPFPDYGHCLSWAHARIISIANDAGVYILFYVEVSKIMDTLVGEPAPRRPGELSVRGRAQNGHM